MSRVCELTGIRSLVGNNVSHSNRKTKTRQLPNLNKKSYHIEELGHALTFNLSTRAIRTIDKQGGISTAILKAKEDLISDRMKQVRRKIRKARSGVKKKS